MSCAVNTSGQATSFSTNRIEDNEVKPEGHKPLTSFFISDILSTSNKKTMMSSSSCSSSPPPDVDDDDRRRHVADDADFFDSKAHQLNFNFHQQLFRFQQHRHQHHHHHLSFPHQLLFAQSTLYNSLGREFPSSHPNSHTNNNNNHHHHHHHHQQQHQLQQRHHHHHSTMTQQHLSEQHHHHHHHLHNQQQKQQRFDKKRLRSHQAPSPVDIKRPWDAEDTSRSPEGQRVQSDDVIGSDEEIEVDVSSYETDDDDVASKATSDKVVCPLDALLRMTSQTFEQEAGPESNGNNGNNSSKNNNGNSNNSSNNNNNGSKKRRKSRTAFTNKQIFELEKRFVYQKYLTPVDRDDIAQSLGLTNAQVITWFQNRRAKLKRDMEELKADVIAAKTLGKEPSTNVLIGGIEELLQGTRDSLRKKPPQKSSNHQTIVNGAGTNHDRRQLDGAYDSPRIVRRQRSPSSDWSGPLRADQSEKENSDVSSVKSDDVTK